MSTNEHNPPAFPKPASPSPSTDYDNTGMTLRDWFAGMAMQGLLASGHFTTKSGDDHPDDGAWMTTHKDPYDDETGDEVHPYRRRFDFAEASWTCADAMLAARKGGQGE